MSEREDNHCAHDVFPPDIHHPNDGNTPPERVANSVIKLQVYPFEDHVQEAAPGLKGEGSIVLSLWVRGGLVGPCQPDSSLPTQFVLSPDGAEILLRELHKTLEQ